MVLDAAVDSACEFKVLRLQPGKAAEEVSVAILRLTADEERELTQTKERSLSLSPSERPRSGLEKLDK